MEVKFLSGRVTLHSGDCREVLATLAENSLDACVCDPPYHLTSIVKRFGAEDAAPAKSNGATGIYERASRGFMGKQWDGGDVAFQPETWTAVYRVLKPGAHLLAMGGTRSFHRLACAIEDAGFEIRDSIAWLYSSGFPKSHDVSKGIDRAAGVEREVIGSRAWTNAKMEAGNGISGLRQAGGYAGEYEAERVNVPITAPTTDAARQWQGWGTALKPAMELICVARKPLSEGTVAGNVLKWGTGALNIDGCRVGVREKPKITDPKRTSNTYGEIDSPGGKLLPDARWPANLVHDGSDEVVAGFPESGASCASAGRNGRDVGDVFSLKRDADEVRGHDDNGGSAARFFYTAKADADDRLGSKHPTVKPLDLMQWLCRLVCPKGGTVLDPFAGTGTTGEAAFREGMHAVLIEAEAEYQDDICRRMALVLAGPDERSRESVKAKDLPRDDGPLFAFAAP